MRIAVLGPIEVVDEGREVALTPQLRRLLGVLVVAGGRAVSVDRLAELVADGRVEGSTVRTAVSRLRKVLDDRVESVEGGYRLVLAPEELDAARFEQLVARARSGSGDVRVAALTRALELWRGRPFGDLADEAWASASGARWDGLRATAMEDLAEASSAAGRHREAAELLEGLLREHPYRERPVELSMRALAADGRVVDGLRVFERFRVSLREELGLDPSAELRAVEAELLAASDSVSGGAAGLPSGTVTFVFTDIEGSTQRWADDEAAMTAALAVHDAVLRDVVAAHGGIVFKHTGDGVCAVFASAPAAVAAAVVAQQQLALPVRMGVHTGEAELRDGDYFGPTLNRVARIMDAGHGGQVLMSRATAALVPEVGTTDLGEHRLKGLSSSERIFQVGTSEFPPLRIATARRGNLPVEISEFVGRRAELEDVAERISRHRAVTLLGVGGTGKTRLAVEVAHRLAPTFPDGCWIAELAQVVVPEAVPHAICIGLAIPVPEHGDVMQHVVSRLRHQRLLLIVDNCEHLLDAAADAVDAVLAQCPTVTVVATSREPLMVSGEHLVPTPSLSADDAVALFVERLGAEAPHLLLDGRQTAAIEAVCERLDRLPLAIELAASRARSMSPVEIEARLGERFRLLVGGRRSRMERHQTMRSTVDWSYELCTDVERIVFDRLSVFAAGFTLESATVVAGGDVDPFDVEDALARLVDRSLVQRLMADDGTTRYRLLETMRAYAQEHLAEAGTLEAMRARHAQHVAEVMASLSLRALGPDEQVVLARIRELAPDALTALDWCIDAGDWRSVTRIATFAVCLASAGLALALFERVHSRLPDAAVELPGVSRLVQLGISGPLGPLDALMVAEHQALAQRFIEAVERRESLPDDALYLSPINETIERFDTAGAAIGSFLDDLDRSPIVVRWYQHLAAIYFLVLIDRDEALRRLRVTEELTARLGSEVASIRVSGIAALVHEQHGDLVAADACLDRALAATSHSVAEVLVACRAIRIRGALNRRLSAEDLRRPFVWDEEASGGRMTETILASVAIGLQAIGSDELARRAAASVWSPDGRAHFAAIFHGNAPEEILRVWRDPAVEQLDRDVVRAEVLAFADRLEASESVGAAVGGKVGVVGG